MSLIIAPFIGVLLLIVITDPYKIIFEYEDYSYGIFPVNRDYISTTYYLDHRGAYHYNSYIFGNSRSSAFLTKDWRSHLNGQISPYHFDASAESLFGVMKKVEFIDNVGDSIQNALLIVDRQLLSQTENRDYHLFIKHYALTNQSKADFYWVFAESLTHKDFVKFYVDYLTGGLITKLGNRIPRDMECLAITNDYLFEGCEESLSNLGDQYFQKYRSYFKKQIGYSRVEEPVIDSMQIIQLNKIKSILEKHQTNYKVVIGPNYNQLQLHALDIYKLEEIFGKAHVYDYSGFNQYSADYKNFYDGSHYRPFVGEAIMKDVYESTTQVK